MRGSTSKGRLVAGARLLAVIVVCGFGGLPAAGCGSSSPATTPDRDAGGDASGEAEAGPSGFATTSCGGCFAQTCQKEVTACHGDPECAAYLVCLQSCSTDAQGNAEASCASQCPAPKTSAGSDAVRALESCRTYATGVNCTDCGASGTDNPILHQQCPKSNDSNACTACYFDHCCDTFDTCEQNADCQGMTDCTDACPLNMSLADCTESCFKKLPNGKVPYAEDFACWNMFCGEICGFPSPYSAACMSCRQASCANAQLACDSDPECFLLSLCVSECGITTQCIDQCAQAHSDKTLELFEAQFVCAQQKCPSACGNN